MLMFDAIEIEKQKFSYSKYAIDIRSVDIDKTMISIRIRLEKKLLNTLLVTKIIKKFSHYAKCFQKWVGCDKFW